MTTCSSSFKPSFAVRPPRFFAASLLLAAAAVLAGCSAAPANHSGDSFPSLLGASHFNGEAVSTLGANFTLPPDAHHRSRLRDVHAAGYTRSGHRAL